MVFGWIWSILTLAAIIWVVYDSIMKQKMENKFKAMWIIITMLTGIIGAGVYYYFNIYKSK